MARRCDRPGCSEPAAVAFGFDARRRLVWLDRLVDDDRARAGALCRRHGERFTVPNGWWLDDRRLEVPELFPVPLPPPSPPASAPGAARRERPRRLVLEGLAEPIEPEAPPSHLVPFAGFDAGHDAADAARDAADAARDAADAAPAGAATMATTPSEAQVEVVVEVVAVGIEVSVAEVAALPQPDLRDLLEPSTPLLARAFSGVARPDRPHRRSYSRPPGPNGAGPSGAAPDPT